MSDTELQNLQAARKKAARSQFESLSDRVAGVALGQVEIWSKSVPIHLLKPESFDDPKSRQKILLDRLIEKLIIWRDNNE